mgnify:CR=1 FL=1
MKKSTLIVNTTSETILSFVLLSVFFTSFVFTNNLSIINIKPINTNSVLGAFKYTETFNPIYFSDDFITVKDANLNVGGESLNVSIQSRKNEESKKLITVYNKEDLKMNVNVILDFVNMDNNSNYYLIINDKEYLVKDSYKSDQYNVLIEIEPQKEASVSVKVKSMDRVNTEFNVIFSEN